MARYYITFNEVYKEDNDIGYCWIWSDKNWYVDAVAYVREHPRFSLPLLLNNLKQNRDYLKHNRGAIKEILESI